MIIANFVSVILLSVNVKVKGYDVEIPWNGFTVHYTIPEFYREG